MIAGTSSTPNSALQRSPFLALPAFSRLGPVALSGALVTLPVFIQAPWVRLAPVSATAFTACLLTAALLLSRSEDGRLRRAGELLVGFCGSWLAGSMFWGWARLHPVCHLPLEACALPLALAGLGSRWRLACGFYLGSLVGTAATDAAIALTGLMPLWPEVLAASPEQGWTLLRLAASSVLEPRSLLVVGFLAAALVRVSQWCWQRGEAGRVAAAALATTLVVDALFMLLALVAPWLSGLV
ncbi:MAG: DUF3120 domain-containing protein [Cyanobium sp. Prado107]|nr:DUF3120 domain-containing protein [Cyanobium sp. Prado107]